MPQHLIQTIDKYKACRSSGSAEYLAPVFSRDVDVASYQPGQVNVSYSFCVDRGRVRSRFPPEGGFHFNKPGKDHAYPLASGPRDTFVVVVDRLIRVIDLMIR